VENVYNDPRSVAYRAKVATAAPGPKGDKGDPGSNGTDGVSPVLQPHAHAFHAVTDAT
jgi:hypothetical protein